MKFIALLLLLSCSLASAKVDDKRAVAAIVGEAANQKFVGQLAVAGAIRNRGNLRGVFGERNSKVLSSQPKWVWQQASKAWAQSATNDITGGATHWENVKAFGEPYWASSMVKTVKIGDHQFYKAKK